MSLKQTFRNWWKAVTVIGTPIILIPVLVSFQSDASRCGYAMLIIIVYWITEAIPIPVTSLLPIILFPLVGVLKATEVAPNYFRDIMALYFGSVALAHSIQNVNLHRRIALLVLTLIGSSIKWALAGLMFTTWLLSMWISNTACTAVMLPVALAIADECTHSSNTLNEESESSQIMGIEEPETDISAKNVENIRKSFILCVLYSTTYGGFATLVGSAVSIFFKGYVDEQYAGTEFKITFFNYLLVSLPVSILMLICCWVWLQIHFGLIKFGSSRHQVSTEINEHLKRILKQQYNALGSLRWNEFIVIGLFLITITLWITRDLDGGYGGWADLFRSGYVSNGTVALSIGILAMILPNERPFTKDWTYRPIVNWSEFSKTFPWGTMTILGAGLSIAQAAKNSRLLDVFADALEFMNGAPDIVIMIAVIIMAQVFTQLISNVSTASIMLPVISSIAQTTGVQPAYLLIPCIWGLSQSFLLPVSSQSNAIVFSTGFIRIRDLVSTGIVMNIVGSLIIILAASTWMIPVFDLNEKFIYNNLTSFNLTG